MMVCIDLIIFVTNVSLEGNNFLKDVKIQIMLNIKILKHMETSFLALDIYHKITFVNIKYIIMIPRERIILYYTFLINVKKKFFQFAKKWQKNWRLQQQLVMVFQQAQPVM